MCGILIDYTFERGGSGIAHRGLRLNKKETPWANYHFAWLPLQTQLDQEELESPVMINSDFFFMFNGEIFNFGPSWRSDTECLKFWLTLCVEDASFSITKFRAFLNGLDGFWAIYIYYRGSEYVVTDPLGKKQLYWGCGAVCSEIRPISEVYAGGLYKDEILTPTDETEYPGVKRFLPNCIYTRVGKQWKPEFVNYFNFEWSQLGRPGDLPSYIEHSVKSRLVNRLDTQSTVLVSGGLDSTIILFHALLIGAPLNLIYVQNEEDDPYIDIIEKWSGIKVIRAAQEEVDRSKAILAYEHSYDRGSVIPQYQICRMAPDHVILTGDGADELFGGYRRAKDVSSYFYDVFVELPYYHNIRLDRIGMHFTKEIRSPFQSHLLVAHTLRNDKDRGKQSLKDAYRSFIPSEIIDRAKAPLRAKSYGFKFFLDQNIEILTSK